ncbi:uncharacterized protein LOC125369532 [Ricinus communis]|uniref:uncharacterized protein LOC125369532 n=1 Tax=Ricinus communis TaxID=3988 RepID=UPI00201A398D|nr:uncharacterized protein LOC125369532 [Ricinus communis]
MSRFSPSDKMSQPGTEDKKKSPVREYQPLIPYPARLKQDKMPRYTRFLKEILSNKRKLEDLGLVTLNEECLAIPQNKLPVKRRDPGSFTVPCIIGDLYISDALADLGASINLMPSSLFEKLDLSEPKPTRMSIQLADRTMKFPKGIVENVLVKGESSFPLILGRPFLATSRAIIDVRDGKLQLRVGITFDLSTSIGHSLDHNDTVYSVDVLDDIVALQAEDEKELSNEDVLEQLACLLASEPSRFANHFVDIDRLGVQKLRPSLEQKEKTLASPRKYPKAFAYKIADILGINPSYCSHKIVMEDSYRLVIQPQR